MKSGKRKIILIGAEGFAGENDSQILVCARWERLTAETNLRDFDVIVFNLLDFDNRDLRKTLNTVRFSEIMNFDVALDVLGHGGEILVVGDPRFEFGGDTSPESGMTRPKYPFLFWTGLDFEWESSGGTTILQGDHFYSRSYAEYAKRFGSWNYSLGSCRINRTTIENRFPAIKNIEFSVTVALSPVVLNRYRHPLIFETRIRVLDCGNRQPLETGPLIFLPPISVTSEETLKMVLRDICKFDAALPEPEWISAIQAPNQLEIDKEIAELEGGMASLENRLREARARRTKTRECLKLLFEREFALEPTVRDILRQLGAIVQDPTEPNKEDGWVSVAARGATYDGVLEIKSTRKDQFDEEGRKQLLDWIQRGISIHQKKYKGLFIGNSAVHLPPEKRPDPFSGSWKKSAELNEICAMTTVDLYRVYVLHSCGAIDLDEFWTTLFNCNGVFPMEKFRKSGSD